MGENIARFGEPDDGELVDAARLAGVHEMVLRLPQGYDTPIGEGGMFLSAGQRQRVALARALYRSPKLVVLDEPNSNLDVEGEAALAETVSGLKAQEVTVVIVTHRSRLLASVDRILLLRDGVVERFGPPAEVLVRAAPAEARPAVIAGQIHPKV